MGAKYRFENYETGEFICDFNSLENAVNYAESKKFYYGYRITNLNTKEQIDLVEILMFIQVVGCLPEI